MQRLKPSDSRRCATARRAPQGSRQSLFSWFGGDGTCEWQRHWKHCGLGQPMDNTGLLAEASKDGGWVDSRTACSLAVVSIHATSCSPHHPTAPPCVFHWFASLAEEERQPCMVPWAHADAA